MEQEKKLKFAANEKVVALPAGKTLKGNKYAITNYGRVISYTTVPQEGIALKQGKIGKYLGATVNRKTYLVHRLVALQFVKKYKPDQLYVIHLDYDSTNNYFENLKWASRTEMETHHRKNPRAKRRGRQKLTAERVRLIKQQLLTGKTRLKMIGKRFGVTDMQIHRIKTGENWGYVKI